MTQKDFSALCREDCEAVRPLMGDSIGIYNEKRLHRILKRYITENESSYEIPVGRFVADILEDGRITEIQTARLDRLLPKLTYYLQSTDHSVTIVYPIIRDKTLIRIDPETGEILRKRLSSAHGDVWDILPELYSLRELIPNERLRLKVMLINAEEYRYSERMRYRKEGRYDSELFPTELLLERELSGREDFLEFIPVDKEAFTAAEYSKWVHRRGRGLYSALNFLCALGLLIRQRDGKRYLYTVCKKSPENTNK